MSDYSTAAANSAESLDEATAGGLIEEYQIGNRRVRRGTPESQVRAAAMLEGLAARRAGGIFRVAKFQEPRK